MPSYSPPHVHTPVVMVGTEYGLWSCTESLEKEVGDTETAVLSDSNESRLARHVLDLCFWSVRLLSV